MQKQRSDVKGCVKHTTLSPCPALFHPCNTQMITVRDCVSCCSFEDIMAVDERSIWGQKLKTFRLRLQAFEVLSYFMLKFDLDTSLVAARIRQNLQTFGSIPSARNYQFPYFCCSWCFWHSGTNCLHLNEMRKVSPANYAISFLHYVFLYLLAALLQNQQQTAEWNSKDNNFNGKKLGTGRWHRLH